MSIPIKETIPDGHEPAPGYIVEVSENGPWLRQDGSVTAVWEERGVWMTTDEAAAALERFCA